MKSLRSSIALISLLVISAFTLILVVGMSVTSLTSYEQRFNFEASTVTYYVAEACLEEALLRLEDNPDFLGTSLSFDSDTNCSITVSGSSPRTLSIIVDFLDYTEQFAAKVELIQRGQLTNSELLSWEEVL